MNAYVEEIVVDKLEAYSFWGENSGQLTIVPGPRADFHKRGNGKVSDHPLRALPCRFLDAYLRYTAGVPGGAPFVLLGRSISTLRPGRAFSALTLP